MKKKQSVTILAATIVSLISLTLQGCNGSKNEAAPHRNTAPPEVSILEIKPERVSITTELSGRVSASLVAEVRPQVGGIIEQMLFSEGSEVKQGDILYQIDPAMYRATYDSAKAALTRAESVLPSALAKVKRFKELVAINAISQQDYDDAQATAKKAEADVFSAKAEVKKARINLAYTSVKAPISGRIGRSSVTTGALVTAFQPVALATIQNLDPVYVDVTQSSASLLQLKKSIAKGVITKDTVQQAKVKLFLEDGTLYPEEGVLKFSDVTVDPGTGSVILRSVFPNPNLTLLPGMFVRAQVKEGINENAILVPQRCVTRNAKGEAVAMTVDSSGKVVSRVLQVDRALENNWLISSGLAPGDKVIMEGLQKIRPGAIVTTVVFNAEDTSEMMPPASEKTAPSEAQN